MSHRQLTASGLSFGYNRTRAVLQGADIEVKPGSRVAILGANGSGKSTLLQCLAGTLAPSAGRVCIDGVDVARTRRGLTAHRQTVQLVFQDPDDQLFSANVVEDVGYGPTNLGLPAQEVAARVERALCLLAIDDLCDRPTHQLSFGQRKRVAIAGAVAMQPCILLLDEPTAGVDPAGIEELFDTLNGLEAAGTTVVLSTHDTALALEWAHEVVVMDRGRTVQGPPAQLLSDAELLRRARLRMPWLLTLARDLIADGVLSQDVHPHTAEQLRAALRATRAGLATR